MNKFNYIACAWILLLTPGFWALSKQNIFKLHWIQFQLLSVAHTDSLQADPQTSGGWEWPLIWRAHTQSCFLWASHELVQVRPCAVTLGPIWHFWVSNKWSFLSKKQSRTKGLSWVPNLPTSNWQLCLSLFLLSYVGNVELKLQDQLDQRSKKRELIKCVHIHSQEGGYSLL